MAEDDRLRDLVAEVAAAYFWNSHIPPAEIPTVVQQIATSLAAVRTAPAAAEQPAEPEPTAQRKATPAQIKKSITPDALISFEDGKPYKTLKRHLSTQGMSLAEYKEKWGLPKDYPTVAPSYSAARSAMAKASGLGALRRTRGAAATPAPAQAPAPVAAAPAKRGRRPKAAAVVDNEAPSAPKRRGRKPAAQPAS